MSEVFRVPVNYGHYLLSVMYLIDSCVARYPENVSSLPFLAFTLLNSLTPEMFKEVYDQLKRFDLYTSLATVFDYGAIPQPSNGDVRVVIPRDDSIIKHLEVLGFSYRLDLDTITVYATPIAATRIARVVFLLKKFVIDSMKRHRLLPTEVVMPLVQL